MAFAAGLLIVILTKNPGDASKIQDIKKAKERLRHHTEQKLQEAIQDIELWAALDGVTFERAVARIYRERGFNVQFTQRTNDQGVDPILKKNGILSIVQCKAYATNVGVSAVRELIEVRQSSPHAEGAILATLFDCSSAAKILTAQHNIKLFSIARDYLRTDYRPPS